MALYKWYSHRYFSSEVITWVSHVFSTVNDYSPHAAEIPDLIGEDELRRQVEVAMRGLEELGVVRRLPAEP
ncbi:hypothetical protein K7G98_43855, partial [Saccharothrix sp. MB29]|nr:hypothetical protein [Saccharothrix sp. MB29]